jgi:antitoxin ParD1/3/4
MPTRNVNLTKHLSEFVDRQVTLGRFNNASEIVREALRLLEDQEQVREAKLRVLRQAAAQGFEEINQGRGITLKDNKSLGLFFKKIVAEASKKAERKNR